MTEILLHGKKLCNAPTRVFNNLQQKLTDLLDHSYTNKLLLQLEGGPRGDSTEVVIKLLTQLPRVHILVLLCVQWAGTFEQTHLVRNIIILGN